MLIKPSLLGVSACLALVPLAGAQTVTLRDSIGPDTLATDGNPGRISCFNEPAGINLTAAARFTPDQPVNLAHIDFVGYQAEGGGNLYNFWFSFRIWDSLAAAKEHPTWGSVANIGPLLPSDFVPPFGEGPPEAMQGWTWKLSYDLTPFQGLFIPTLPAGHEYIIGVCMVPMGDAMGTWATSLSSISAPPGQGPDAYLTPDGGTLLPVDENSTGRFAVKITGIPVPCAPVITRQPQSRPGCAGVGVPFSIEAGGPGELVYQWQARPVYGDLWAAIGPGHFLLYPCFDGSAWITADTPNSPATTITAVPCPGYTRLAVRCIVYNGCTWVPSDEAFISVCPVDTDCDGDITPADIAGYINLWLSSIENFTLDGDFDRSGAVEPADVAVYIAAWFAAVVNGC